MQHESIHWSVQLLLISAWGLCLPYLYLSRSDRPLAAMTLIDDRTTDRSLSRSLNVFMSHVVRSAVKSTYSIEDHCKVLLHCHVAGCRYPIRCHLSNYLERTMPVHGPSCISRSSVPPLVFLGEHCNKMPFILLEPENADTEADVMTGDSIRFEV